MFVYGSQPGWFALEGIDGWLPYLEEEGNTDVVDFIASLMRYRTLGSEYLVEGQLMRPLIVAHNNLFDSPIVCTPTIASAVWSSQEKNSLGKISLVFQCFDPDHKAKDSFQTCA
jgi:hypothetical protein